MKCSLTNWGICVQYVGSPLHINEECVISFMVLAVLHAGNTEIRTQLWIYSHAYCCFKTVVFNSHKCCIDMQIVGTYFIAWATDYICYRFCRLQYRLTSNSFMKPYTLQKYCNFDFLSIIMYIILRFNRNLSFKSGKLISENKNIDLTCN